MRLIERLLQNYQWKQSQQTSNQTNNTIQQKNAAVYAAEGTKFELCWTKVDAMRMSEEKID